MILGKFLYGFLDKFIGSPVSYEEVTVWGNGSPMTSELCDGILWVESSGKFYRRVLEDNVIHASWYGVSSTVADNAPLINNLIEYLPEGTGWIIQLPRGQLRCSTTITMTKKSIWLKGVREATALIYPGGVVGINSLGGFGGDRPRISMLTLFAEYRVSDGLVGGVKSKSGQDYKYHGIVATTITEMDDVIVANFSGNGINISADIYVDTGYTGQDASRCQLTRVTSKLNGGNGMYFLGGDANKCNVQDCDVRDNTLWGIQDDSLLGNDYTRVHANGNAAGHYTSTNPNNRTSWTNCYGESGYPPSIFAGVTSVIGGFHANGYETSQFALVQDGNRFNSIVLGTYLALGGNSIYFGGFDTRKFFLQPAPNRTANKTHYILSRNEESNGQGILAWYEAGEKSPGRVVQPNIDMFGTQVQHIGGVLICSMKRLQSFSQDLPSQLLFPKGSIVNIEDPFRQEPKSYRCIEQGLGSAAKWEAQGHGVGTTSQRLIPSQYLFGNDAFIGWRYWNTDTKRNEYYDGTNWIN